MRADPLIETYDPKTDQPCQCQSCKLRRGIVAVSMRNIHAGVGDLCAMVDDETDDEAGADELLVLVKSMVAELLRYASVNLEPTGDHGIGVVEDIVREVVTVLAANHLTDTGFMTEDKRPQGMRGKLEHPLTSH